MNEEIMKCFICNNRQFTQTTKDYLLCKGCGHEILKKNSKQEFIINDVLSIKDIQKETSLDKFKFKVLKKYLPENNKGFLLDIGSSSGKFLHLNRNKFKKIIGLEVTKECIEFSTNVLGLDIRSKIEDIPNEIDLVTAWHSLEHIPENELENIMHCLSSKLKKDGRVIVCVPNNQSFQYKIFKSGFAYYDVPHHLHQFSPESLSIFMRKFGFKEESKFVSRPYIIFGYIQGLLNFFNPVHNYMYYRIKRKDAKPSLLNDLINIIFLPLSVIVGALLSPLDLISKKKQSVLTICFKK